MAAHKPTFCITVLTYNRLQTIQPRLDSYVEQAPDLLNLVDNGSTDGTGKALTAFAKQHGDAVPISLDCNRINLGYSRSLMKSFFLCEQDYQILLSDEDAPSASFLSTYRDVHDRFGPQGVIARATPYPKVWSVPELDKTEILFEDDTYTVIKPGLYAAHLASYQAVYVGGLCVAPDAVKNAHLITFEQGCYPQRFLAMDAAYHGGMTLLKSEDVGQFPAVLASDKKESMTPRLGDWGIAECIAQAHHLAHFYDAGDISSAAYDAIAERQMRYAYTRTPIYFKLVCVHGEEHGLDFLRSVQHSSTAFSRPLFWDYVHSHVNAAFDTKTKALFRTCCDRLQQEMDAPAIQGTNPYLHNYKGFGHIRVTGSNAP